MVLIPCSGTGSGFLQGVVEMEDLTIGQVARKAGVNVMTVRYYERLGLLPYPPRSVSGYRQYDSGTVHRIHFIKSAQRLGFSLREISGLLSLRIEDKNNCEEVKRRADKKIGEIEEKMRVLENMKKALKKLTAACTAKMPTGSECPILEALGKDFRESRY